MAFSSGYIFSVLMEQFWHWGDVSGCIVILWLPLQVPICTYINYSALKMILLQHNVCHELFIHFVQSRMNKDNNWVVSCACRAKTKKFRHKRQIRAKSASLFYKRISLLTFFYIIKKQFTSLRTKMKQHRMIMSKIYNLNKYILFHAIK